MGVIADHERDVASGAEARRAAPRVDTRDKSVRHRPGGPPAVRNLEHIYGLPTNTPEQQKEADEGSLLSIRSTNLLGEQIQAQRRRQVPEAATLENPPGTWNPGFVIKSYVELC